MNNDRFSRKTCRVHLIVTLFAALSFSAGQAFPYDRTTAIDYAEQWWNDRNSSNSYACDPYQDYNNRGGDCANFVSQCLIAGGLDLSTGTVDSCGCIISCTRLNAYIESLDAEHVTWLKGHSPPEPVWFLPGDVAIFGYTDGQNAIHPYAHAVIAVTGDDTNYATCNAHSDDRYHWTIEQFFANSNFDRCTFYRMPDQSTSGTNPTATEICSEANVLSGEYKIPAQVIKGVMYQESEWRQFDTITGNPLVSGDGGIGIMQVTPQQNTGYWTTNLGRIASGLQGDNSFTIVVESSQVDVDRLKTDWRYNLEIGCRILLAKKVACYGAGDDASILENWYYPLAYYNGFAAGGANDPSTNYSRSVSSSGDWKSTAVFPYQECIFNLIAQLYPLSSLEPEIGACFGEPIKVTLPGPSAVSSGDGHYSYVDADFQGGDYVTFYSDNRAVINGITYTNVQVHRVVLGQPEDDFPAIDAFYVESDSVTVGASIHIIYAVSDNVGLQQVELWRATDDDGNGLPNWPDDPQGYVDVHDLSGQTNNASEFYDWPPSEGVYWYGLHVKDSSGQVTYERDPPGPIKVTVNPSTPTLVRIEVSGSTQVNENSGDQYTCTAYYSDGSTSNVTNSASWSQNSSYATISSTGYLTTSPVTSDQPCTITATYSGYSDTYDVTIKNVTASLDRIEISGSTEVSESSGAQYTCTAYYSDGSTSNVTNSASWSQNSPYATISSTGYLTTSPITSDQPCTITATYSGYSDTHDVTIKDVPPDGFWKSPTATGKSDNEWTNPTYAYSSDDNYATATGTYLEQDYYNFNFDLPSGATPTGIQVKIEGHGYLDGEGNYRDSRILVYIWSASSSSWGRQVGAGWWAFALNGDETLTKPDGTADLWGTSGLSDFDNANFKLRIQTFSSPYLTYIDRIQVKVYYTEPPPSRIISGYVRTSEGSGIPGVMMSGLLSNPTTNGDGYYSDTVPYGWSGTVTPSKAGYIFDPNSRTYTNVTADQTAQNYTGTLEIVGDFCGPDFGPPDGYVDVWDLMQFADHWHTRTGEGNWDAKFDLTGPNFGDTDGYADVWDLMVFADNWHKGQKP